MKKITLVLLAAVMLLSCFACGGDADKKDDGKEKNAAVYAWATHMTDKQIANLKPVENGSTEYTVYMTKGETEGCQLVIHSTERIKKGTLTLASEEVEGITAQGYVMNKTHTIKKREWTDSAIPYYGRKMVIDAGKNIPFIVEFTTTKDTPAGDYEFKYEFTDTEAEKVLATFTVKVHVWDITLPEEKTFQTSVGLNAYHIGRFDTSGADAYKRYYDLLLEHNVAAHTLPYDILDERADAYMSDPRVTSFVIGLWEAGGWSDEKILSYYEKLKTNETWLKKALFYVIDEPTTEESFKKYNDLCIRLGELCPEIGVIAPFYTNYEMGNKKDQLDIMAENTILWCPKLCLWDDERSYGDFNITWQEKSFAERMKEFQAEGDTVWSYVCNDPIDPYAQLFIDTDGLVHRLMMWQHYQRDITGFLYWSVNTWGYRDYKEINPWEQVYNGVNDGGGSPVYGEGYLLYPGIKVGIPGAVGSLRLKLLRDGIDDIELFYVAEQVLGKEAVMKWVDEATPTLTTYTTEERFYEIRIEMGNAIEAALKNS